MGTSKKFAAHYDRLAQEREIAQLAKRGPLQSLTSRELQLDLLPVTISPKPERVKAWVRFGEDAYLVTGHAERWTDYAVGVSFIAHERVYRCWVWSSAVTPIRDLEISENLGSSRSQF